MSAQEPATQAANLANLLLALLAPMFLWSTAGDLRLARIAAAQTLNEYCVGNRLSLITAAKIIAFDIATLSSLSLSMYEDVSMSLALRLRGNANSLDRAAERNRRALEAESRKAAGGDPVEIPVTDAGQMPRDAGACAQSAEPEARPTAEPADAPVPVPPAAGMARTAADKQRTGWAAAMTAVAEELTTGLKDLLPGEDRPDQHWQDMARIEALAAAAAGLVTAAPPSTRTMAGA
jgi:hypothetical protein